MRGMQGTCNPFCRKKKNGSKFVFLLRFCGRWVCCVAALTNVATFDPVFFSKKTMGQSPCFFFSFFAPIGF